MLGKSTPIDTSLEFMRSVDGGSPERLRFRVNAVSCLRKGRRSITITLRSIPTTPPTYQTLGVEDEIIEACLKSSQGICLVAGATGHGKSTLLASILRGLLEVNEGAENLVTIEHPIEFVYDDVNKGSALVTQMEVGRDIASFSKGVENALRMAPTTILIGESRDQETITKTIEAGNTGHLAYSTLHANSVSASIARMVSACDVEIQNKIKVDLIDALKLIVAQRLL
ncbi:MAG: defect in organelle trafficking protein DotB (ATPase), partial [Phototrophicales bacterium]